MGFWKCDKACLLTFRNAFNVSHSLQWKLNFMIKQLLFMSPIRMAYTIAVLLTDCYNCLYGSQVSCYSNLQPPTKRNICKTLISVKHMSAFKKYKLSSFKKFIFDFLQIYMKLGNIISALMQPFLTHNYHFKHPHYLFIHC